MRHDRKYNSNNNGSLSFYQSAISLNAKSKYLGKLATKHVLDNFFESFEIKPNWLVVPGFFDKRLQKI